MICFELTNTVPHKHVKAGVKDKLAENLKTIKTTFQELVKTGSSFATVSTE